MMNALIPDSGSTGNLSVTMMRYQSFTVSEAAGLSITDSVRHDVNLPVFTFRDVILPSDFTSSRHLSTICAF